MQLQTYDHVQKVLGIEEARSMVCMFMYVLYGNTSYTL
jgi:hypothetical protein